MERGKPVVLPSGESEPQGEPMGLRVEDGGESEGQPVTGWIGVEPPVEQHHPTRKRANFHRVLDGRKGEEVGNEMFR